ncbi:MAG TPA: hypothetical protein VM900_15000 [Sphingomonas sp.]|jgi:hypothetical protein|nr:hypothetical protein [Sphingomonas sp.]
MVAFAGGTAGRFYTFRVGVAAPASGVGFGPDGGFAGSMPSSSGAPRRGGQGFPKR